jgi:hypothetical protein
LVCGQKKIENKKKRMFKQVNKSEDNNLERGGGDLVQLDDRNGNNNNNSSISNHINTNNISTQPSFPNDDSGSTATSTRDTYAFFFLLFSIIIGLILIGIAYIYDVNEPQRIGYLVFGVSSFITGVITYTCIKRLSVVKESEIRVFNSLNGGKRRTIFGYTIKMRK